MGVATGLSLRLELTLLFAEFLALAFQDYSFIQQGLEVGECMTLQLIVEWPYQSVQETILPLCISVNFIGRLPRQLCELVSVLAN